MLDSVHFNPVRIIVFCFLCSYLSNYNSASAKVLLSETHSSISEKQVNLKGKSSKTLICQFGGYCVEDSDCVAGNRCVIKDPMFYSQCLPNNSTYLPLSSGCIPNFAQACDDSSTCCDPGATCNNRNFRQCSQIGPPLCVLPLGFSNSSSTQSTPSQSPTAVPTPIAPSELPSHGPTAGPSQFPSVEPVLSPSLAPVSEPSENPTTNPSPEPTTGAPTSSTPTFSPSEGPSEQPVSSIPTEVPSVSPSNIPTLPPSDSPSEAPTASPSTEAPTSSPSTEQPSTEQPTTTSPSTAPTESPSQSPSTAPSQAPTESPSISGTEVPSQSPSFTVSETPSTVTTDIPTEEPSTASPSETANPTETPSLAPSVSPLYQTEMPSLEPTLLPPSASPTLSNKGSSNSLICQYGGYCLKDSDCVSGNKCVIVVLNYYSQCLPDPSTYLPESTGCIANYAGECNDNSTCCDPGATCNNREWRQCAQPVSPKCLSPAGYNSSSTLTSPSSRIPSVATSMSPNNLALPSSAPSVAVNAGTLLPSSPPSNGSLICQYGGFCRKDSDCVAGNTCVFVDSDVYSQCLPDVTSYLPTSTGCLSNYAQACDDASTCCDPGAKCNSNSFRQCSQPVSPTCRNPLQFDSPLSTPSLSPSVLTGNPITWTEAPSAPPISSTISLSAAPVVWTVTPTSNPVTTASNAPISASTPSPIVVPQPTQTPVNANALICQYGGYCKADSDCVPGNKCFIQNGYYSQCVPDSSVYSTSPTCLLNYVNGCSDSSSCCDPGAKCNAQGQCAQPQSPDCLLPSGFSPLTLATYGFLVFSHTLLIEGIASTCSELQDITVLKIILDYGIAETMNIPFPSVTFSDCQTATNNRKSKVLSSSTIAVTTTVNVPLSDVSAAESTYNDLTASLTDPSVSSTLSSNLVALATAVGQSDVFPSSVTVADAIIPTFDPSFVQLVTTGDTTNIPTEQPSISPVSAEPSIVSSDPSYSPTEHPSNHPTVSPSVPPVAEPSVAPTADPSDAPQSEPTLAPQTEAPTTGSPTIFPTEEPTISPSLSPSNAPAAETSEAPTDSPLEGSMTPTAESTLTPTRKPTSKSTKLPKPLPSTSPTNPPSRSPSTASTTFPTSSPSTAPSTRPSDAPSVAPSEHPTVTPSVLPSTAPSDIPTTLPSEGPTFSPSSSPIEQSSQPTSIAPTSSSPIEQSSQPTSIAPTSSSPIEQSSQPPSTSSPTEIPTTFPSNSLTESPSDQPSLSPSIVPSVSPVATTESPSFSSTANMNPTIQLTQIPSLEPSNILSETPSIIPTVADTSAAPVTLSSSNNPTVIPTSEPSESPTSIAITFSPTAVPSVTPSSIPTGNPQSNPTKDPIFVPSASPSSPPLSAPTLPPVASPSKGPTTTPSVDLSKEPIANPSASPITFPTSGSTTQPSTPLAIKFESLIAINSLPSTATTLDNSSRTALTEAVDLCLDLTVGSSRYLSDTLYVNGNPKKNESLSSNNSIEIISHVETTVLLSLFPAFSGSPSLLFDQLRANLSAAISNGRFVKILNSVSLVKYALLTSTATTQGNTLSINLVILHPTFAPTVLDVPVGSSSSQSSSSSSSSVGAITAASVVVVSVVVIVMAVFYFGLRRRQKMNKQKEESIAAAAALEKAMQVRTGDEQKDGIYVHLTQQRAASDFRFYLQKDSSPIMNETNVMGMNACITSGDSVQYELDATRLVLDGENMHLSSFSGDNVVSPKN